MNGAGERSKSEPRRNRGPLLAATGLVALLLFSCQLFSPAPQSDLAQKYGVDREQAVFVVSGQPRTLDPAKTLGGPDGPVGHIFSGLISLDTDLQVQSDLAAGWTVGDDGRTITFYLRKNALFHDGRPVTAHDVVFSWERAANPATGSNTVQTYLGDIVGVDDVVNGAAPNISGLRILDDHTLEVRLSAPVVYFLAKLAYPVTFVVDRDNVVNSDWERSPNGTGSFTLQLWRDDEVIVLARNASYYLQLPDIENVVYFLGAGLPLSLYETGEIDLVGVGAGTLERVSQPEDPLLRELQLGVSMCTSVIGLNNALAPFDDVRVRKAFNYALDRQRLIDTFSPGSALVARGILPPGMPGFNADNAGYGFDPEEARRLLAEAGYPGGRALPELTYTTSGYGGPGDYVTSVITMWQEHLHVTVTPAVLDPFTYYDELYAGNVGHVYAGGWCADYPDPQNFLDVLYHSESRQNIGRFANPEIDALLVTARTERDVPTRLALYADIEQKIIDEAASVFVSHGLSAVLVKPRIQGYVLTAIGVPQWHRITLVP